MKAIAYGTGLLVLVLAAVFFVVGCGKAEEAASKPAAPARVKAVEKPSPADAIEIAQKFCPVRGKPISKDVYIDYEGKRVYFCCPMCVDTFEKDPAQYPVKPDAQPQGDAEHGQSQEAHDH